MPNQAQPLPETALPADSGRAGNGLRFAGLAHVLPSREVHNSEVLDQLAAHSAAHLSPAGLREVISKTRTAFRLAGTETRFLCAADERASDLCVAAGKAALEDAGLGPKDIDLLIYVGVGRGFLEPATANVFQDLLGLERATCFDILDACASWIRALHVARTMILAGAYRCVMILNAEFMGRECYRYALRSVEEFDYWFPGVTIGEAATATIVQAGPETDDFAATFRNQGANRGMCLVAMPNVADYLGQPPISEEALIPFQFVSFGGPLLECGADMLQRHYLEEGPNGEACWDHIFGHAASNMMCVRVGRACGLDESKFHFVHQKYGNTVSASVPLAMSVARQSGALKDGDRTLIMVASAGMASGIISLTYRS